MFLVSSIVTLFWSRLVGARIPSSPTASNYSLPGCAAELKIKICRISLPRLTSSPIARTTTTTTHARTEALHCFPHFELSMRRRIVAPGAPLRISHSCAIFRLWYSRAVMVMVMTSQLSLRPSDLSLFPNFWSAAAGGFRSFEVVFLDVSRQV